MTLVLTLWVIFFFCSEENELDGGESEFRAHLFVWVENKYIYYVCGRSELNLWESFWLSVLWVLGLSLGLKAWQQVH